MLPLHCHHQPEILKFTQVEISGRTSFKERDHMQIHTKKYRNTPCTVYHPFYFQSHYFQPKCMNNAWQISIQAVYKTKKLLPYLLPTYKPLEEMSKYVKKHIYNTACDKHKVVNLKVSGIRLLTVYPLGDVWELRCQKLSDTPQGRVKNLILWIMTPCSFLQSISCVESSTSNPKYIKFEYKLWSSCCQGRNRKQVSTKQSKHHWT